MHSLVPTDRQYSKPRHTHVDFSTTVASTIMATAPGTGLICIPVYYRVMASSLAAAVASVNFRVATTAGTVVIGVGAPTSGLPTEGPWWDDQTAAGVGANNALVLQAAAGIGNGTADLWYVIVRSGAGGAGTTL